MRTITKSGIYFIRNIFNEKVYVGSSVNVYDRLKAHRGSLIKNKHANSKLQNAWNKYGKENFEFYCVEKVADLGFLIQREQYWIDKMNACKEGYNNRHIAESNRGLIISLENKRKLSEANKGKRLSDQTKILISKFHKGRIHSEDHIRKVAEGNKGKNVSEEVRKRISEKLKGRPIKLEILAKRSEIIVSEETRRKISEGHRGKKHKKRHWALIGEYLKRKPFQRRVFLCSNEKAEKEA